MGSARCRASRRAGKEKNKMAFYDPRLGPRSTIDQHIPSMLPAMPLARPGMDMLPGMVQRGPTGIAALLQRPGLRDALFATGTSMLAQTNAPGGTLGALGQALPMGMMAFQQGKQEAEIDALLESAPPEMKRLLKALPAQARVPALLSMMKPKEPVKLGKDDRLIEQGTNRVLVDAIPEVEKAPDEVRTFEAYAAMTPEQQANYREFLKAKRGPGNQVTVNTGGEGGAQKAIGEVVYNTITGAEGAQANLQKVADIDRIVQITQDPEFKKVSGPIMGSKWGELNARFADDPKARELLAEFNAIGGQMTMDQLEEFTGPKTDFEFRQAKRLVLNDPTMTVDEIRSGLKVHRAAAIQDANRWSDRMRGLDPSKLKFDPELLRTEMDLAEQIKRQFPASQAGGKVDPLGIRRP
jgi:hypothetical protein